MKYRLVKQGQSLAATKPQAFGSFEEARDYACAMVVAWRAPVEIWRDHPSATRPMAVLEEPAKDAGVTP